MKHTRATIFGFLILLIIAGGAIFFLRHTPATDTTVVCTMEAKICPDGTSVGRSGLNCEFTPCPTQQIPEVITPEPAATTASLNQKILTNGIHITPLEVLEDSRCPADVRCIQAGTVRVRVLLEHSGETHIEILTLTTPIVFGGKHLTLLSVSPIHTSTHTIVPDEYRFQFLVTDTNAVSVGK